VQGVPARAAGAIPLQAQVGCRVTRLTKSPRSMAAARASPNTPLSSVSRAARARQSPEGPVPHTAPSRGRAETMEPEPAASPRGNCRQSRADSPGSQRRRRVRPEACAPGLAPRARRLWLTPQLGHRGERAATKVTLGAKSQPCVTQLLEAVTANLMRSHTVVRRLSSLRAR
jgi:hypothetical protein